jgi:hypothetical protein
MREKKNQLSWLEKSRKKCSDEACLSQVYKTRMEEINKSLWALPSETGIKFSTAEYYTEEELFAGKRSLGKYYTCLKLYSADNFILVDFHVYFPDSQQTLEGKKIPVKVDSANNLDFRFIDGWNNRGKGLFRKTGGKYILELEEVMPSNEPYSKNILRQYGSYTLKHTRCKKP